ncbi:YcxB family protein [Caulobacter sp. S45]|uniref:YcxB family protein n=1 Tax=Caulobacter sp. S45 TaxID=1641861 RepID=UPI00131E748D|nr:YcxB family protein [Caulobacter sp. S45]
MTQTAEVGGESPFFEGLSMGKVASRLILGPWRFARPLLIVAILVLGAATILVMIYLPPSAAEWTFAPVSVYVVVLLAAAFATRRLIRQVSLKRWYARGTPHNVQLMVRISDEGFRIEAETATTILHWPFVSEITTEKNYWFVYVAAQIYFVPRRFFTDAQQERAFVAAVLDQLPPVARTRSRKAEDYVAGRLALTQVK